MVDLQLLDRGDVSYTKLNRSYIIFICTFDICHQGRHIYTFENYCKEDKQIALRDDTVKIFLNAAGEMDDVNEQLKAFLDYVAGKRPDDAYIEKLEHVNCQTPQGGRSSVQLIAEKGKEDFYLQKGFKMIPHESCGSGMRKVIRK